MGKAVQLRGTPVILQAYDRIGIPTWALFYEQKCLFKCGGENLEESKAILRQFLQQLEQSNTSATYDLRFYEELKDKKKIKAGTEPDYSYNIVLFDPEEYPSPGALTRREGYATILQELQDVKAQLALRQKEEEDEEEEAVGSGPGWIGAVNKLLDNPDIQQKLGDRILGFLDNLLSKSINQLPMTTQREAGTIGSTGNPHTQTPVTITQEQYEKIQSSVQVLAGIDPQLGDHLEKIAQLAQKNPVRYKSLISMLNTFV